MFQFLIKRAIQAFVVMFIISIFCFLVQDSLGDPTRELAAMSMSDAEREDLKESLGLNDPLLVQYGRFAGRALQGDLGNSYFFKEPALTVIMKKLPATLELAFAASFLIITISIPLGEIGRASCRERV